MFIGYVQLHVLVMSAELCNQRRLSVHPIPSMCMCAVHKCTHLRFDVHPHVSLPGIEVLANLIRLIYISIDPVFSQHKLAYLPARVLLTVTLP